MSTEQPNIVVVGAGPTGLTLGCQLLRLGVECRLIDKSSKPTAHSRAIGISPRSLEVLDEFDAADELVDIGHEIGVANLCSRGNAVGKLTAASDRSTRFQFMLAIPQYDTERVLRARFTKLGGTIEVGELRDLRVPDPRGSVHLSIETPSGIQGEEAALVIGCDGRDSRVRESLGVELVDEPMEVSFYVVDAFVESGPARFEGHYFFSPDGLMVVVPLADGSYRFAATVTDREREESEGLKHLRELVADRVPRHVHVQRLRDAGWGGNRVSIRPAIAATARVGPCLLAGDSAHVFSPVGGQGMNSGIQDAHNLAWKLAVVSSGRADPRLLDSYVAERLPVWRSLMKASNAQTRMASIRPAPLRLGRDLLLRVATRTGMLDKKMTPVFTQLNLEYGGARGRGPAGRRLPNQWVEREGARIRIFDAISKDIFTVLAEVVRDEQMDAVTRIQAHMAKRHPALVRVVPVRGGGAPDTDRMAGLIRDAEGWLASLCRGVEGPVLLVRPDAHIAACASLDDWSAVAAHLDHIAARAAPAARTRMVGGREPGSAQAGAVATS